MTVLQFSEGNCILKFHVGKIWGILATTSLKTFSFLKGKIFVFAEFIIPDRSLYKPAQNKFFLVYAINGKISLKDMK